MGDRVLFQIVDGTKRVSPVIYGHWLGYRAREIVATLRHRMADRAGDVDYAAARLIQECCSDNPEENLGVGVWNAFAPHGYAERLRPEDSHGDAGIVIIDCSNNFRCECFGGYLRTDENGLPCV